ncbi:MAG: multifunctional oxoglutarate decarboxylase/oxoglutarate dehydrogenase thiamine pyrophosphate-binding subunit/dihydrolipoyllysine-residue succinyltransferase subunit [Chloroflexi bacterium]|nr:MAG: multifunctional oxoglutarate decarboxylase/oxoglutarate dehydrogenase thiamine pyrophosphate-binding subunit/dihydrolipoyllysine-residue succinyltransferase subunit [Chloroflexota bacterium]
MSDTVPVTLPAMGESVTEGVISRWRKAPGDTVKEGETVVEVTTDKVDVEVPAPTAGTVAEILAEEGASVEVGAVLATIAPGAASAATPPERDGEAPHSEPAASAPGAAPVAARAPVEASPLARRAAAINAVDPHAVAGSGPAGLVRRRDVDALSRHDGARPDSAPGVAAGDTAEVLRGPGAVLVDYMERSRDIPTATSFRTISVRKLDARRRELNLAISAAGHAGKVSFTHLIGYAIARAAVEMPEMTAHFARTDDGKPARVAGGSHLGIAVDSRRADGTRFLVVPVIRDAGTRPFKEFREEYERLIDRARNNALTADELQGATFTLTNPGGIGTVASVPRLMNGQGTIIAVGAIGYPAEWHGVSDARIAELGAGKVMTMTSTYDHRIIQGAQSGEFLGRVEALLGGADGFYDAVFASLGFSAAAPPVESPAPALQPSPVAAPPAEAAERTLLGAMQAATSLIKAHRTHGHLGAHLDPLGTPPIGDPAMDPATYGLTPALMEAIPADLLRVYAPGQTLAEVLPELRRTYCGTIAFEIEHISSHEQRVWLREHIESGAYRVPFSAQDRLRLLQRLTKVDAMERYLRRTFIGQKTFSIEGLDAMVPMLEALLGRIADESIAEVVMGMAHRGRLAVIAHVVNRPYESILNAFELGVMRRAVGKRNDDPTGDVKYHTGATGTYVTDTGKAISVRLLPNPSHLEAVDAVVEGWSRAEQTRRDAAQVRLDRTAALPILIHGDAAFSGQGVVAEVLNLQSLDGYSTGGTVHIIADNQIGFTTEPEEARSTRYASDMAKGFDIPIVHVNADDIEACIGAVRFAWDYLSTYHRDVVIDLIGYRRFGHNETDEPAYTQPLMYQKIRQHPGVRELFARSLVDEGLISEQDAQTMAEEAYARVGAAHKRVKDSLTAEVDDEALGAVAAADLAMITAVPADALIALDDQLLSTPDGFTPSSKLTRQFERRRASMTEGGIDWGTAEALAFASLLLEGKPIRLTGQDTVRGTFSQRHLAFHDERTGEVWIPMQHLPGAQATFEVHNSPLSEVGCLGFEYGYSAADPATFVLWEAQYGDFFNNAQMVVDQFIASARAKWGQRSRLTLLLPHGYEGSGPEHSSARIERFLQLSADGNMRVANCSTAAQYFHLLRNQAHLVDPHPLVVVTPKSLLRLRESASTLDELSGGGFRTVIDDPMMSDRREQVTTLLLCSGRVYYDLVLHPMRQVADDMAIARVELLAPLPIDDIAAVFGAYPHLEQLIWVQEEPANMGAWGQLERAIGLRRPSHIRWDYIGRPRRASPSEGYAGSHQLEQERIIEEALMLSTAVRERVPAATTADSPPAP